ncbi:helix-turn-helix transcriptional regulator [Parvularcula maris]|uniref:AraC family transcriptional regulator n=1 Tax=Parvularcula maris TaxID=2965077 RepID=A0A9X2L7Q3_9PROT|nr:AraC family transcriptional regulator [Parvularcula maris]MCQ8184641.1 AraC family transcriptional regulator [Parvularcula maris]
MFEGLYFGWRTALLGMAVAPTLLIAFALFRTASHRQSNQLLGVLLLVLVGVVTPWIIGFAGFYDRWPELTSAPFAITLAIAPLFYGYLTVLVTGAFPSFWRLHLAPAALQFAVLFSGFLLPLPLKTAWSMARAPIVNPATDAAFVVGMVVYGWLCLDLIGHYQTALAASRSDDARFALPWLRNVVAAGGALFAAGILSKGVGLFVPLGYEGLLYLHAALALIALYLAVEGWRHSRLTFPRLGDLQADSPAPPSPPEAQNWSARGQVWRCRIEEEGWATEPDLTIAELAQRLGTNTHYLSRALNEGLGVNFSTFVNGLRAEVVAARLEAGDERALIDIALEAGFGSKATFNRVFRQSFGMSPTAYRAAVSQNQKNELRAGI